MASNMFDLPDPLSPVIALKCGSNLLGSNSNDDDEKMSGKDWQGELLNKNERMIMIVFPSVVNTEYHSECSVLTRRWWSCEHRT